MKELISRVINRAVRPFGLTCVVKPEIRPAPDIPEDSLKNAQIVPDRTDGLYLLPKGGVVAEIGVAFGNFSKEILRVVQPKQFVAVDTFDLDKASWTGRRAYEEKFEGLSHEDYYRRRFHAEISEGQVAVKKGFSSVVMTEFPDKFFDIVYIDAAHDYENVKKDLEIATKKIKDSGAIILNDYTVLDPILLQPYGIVQAVNELCEKGGWEFVYLALHRYMFCDVALRKVPT